MSHPGHVVPIAIKLLTRNPYSLSRVVQHYPKTHPWIRAYKRVGKWIAAYIEDMTIAAPHILEIGSGRGELALAIVKDLSAKRRAFVMRLVEPSPLMRANRVYRIVEGNSNVAVCRHSYPGGHRACSNASFDAVISILSFHHLLNWQAELLRMLRDSERQQIFFSGIEIGDAVFIGTGKGHCSDLGARAFWIEYHSALELYGIRPPARPGPLTPWDDKPLQEALRKSEFRRIARKEWMVSLHISYGETLKWIEDGALTSLLAFGRANDRRVLGVHMRHWLSAMGIKSADCWSYSAGVRCTVFKRGAGGTTHKWN
jgi:SAM-dependent methyltransferase